MARLCEHHIKKIRHSTRTEAKPTFSDLLAGCVGDQSMIVTKSIRRPSCVLTKPVPTRGLGHW